MEAEKPKEKELVVASMAADDTSWLDEFFGDWTKNVYVVNNRSAPLTVPMNKGREAMPFLTYAYPLCCLHCCFHPSFYRSLNAGLTRY